MQKHVSRSRSTRWVVASVGASLLAPTLVGCGGQPSSDTTPSVPPPPPPPRMNANNNAPTKKTGLTTKQKVVLVAGAALLYYLYKKHENAKTQTGADGKYFISESTGRVYYRDLKTGKFQWVSPPAQPMQVPQSDIDQYGLQKFQGYDNGTSGQQFGGYGATSQGSYTDTQPATNLP